VTTKISIDDQIKCVQREIGMRERVYPGWVEKGKMRPEKADYEITAMKAVLGSLQIAKTAGLTASSPEIGP
jgi:hypothetical protein